jgi:competence protein ComEC
MAIQANTSDNIYSGIPARPAKNNAALQHRVWRSFAGLSSRIAGSLGVAEGIEQFLDNAGFDRAPWLAVGFGSGIGLWFLLGNWWQWLGLIALGLGAALAAAVLLHAHGRFPYLRLALVSMALMVAAGCATVWTRSAVVGTPPIVYPTVATVTGRVLDRDDQPVEGRVRLLLVTREPRTDRVIRVRVTIPAAMDLPGLVEGAIVRLRARLMPPSAPLLPGSFDFARADWFEGVSATGSAIAPPRIVAPATGGHFLSRAQHALAVHIRSQIAGSAGGIGAVLATGERGGIAAADAQAMRDAGLAHLLAVSGLHVSAVVGMAYMVTFRVLALIPAIALRLRLPLLAAGSGALFGVGYTLLTGAHVPTVRACLGALLVLAALALGRQPLNLRLLAVAALVVMLLWPESVAGPSFQMSFGSVIAIVALHNTQPVRDFLAHRAEPRLMRIARELAMILVGGMVIDLALMPIALFHFQRAGLYGALANLVAIPLTTFMTMPLIALSLMLDMVGVGAPVWWLAGKSLALLLAIAHRTADLPGSVTLLPTLGTGRYLVFIAAMLWLGLWRGNARLLALIPALLATLSLAWLRPPDVVITGDGRNLGIVSGDGAELMVLREGRSSFTRNEMLESAGMAGNIGPLDKWPGAHCNHDFCLVEFGRGGRIWHLLIARTRVRFSDNALADDALARACAGVDIVIAQQRLFGPCRPALIKADRALLMQTGGLALDLVNRQVTSVAAGQGDHPWWRTPHHAPSGYGDAQTSAGGVDPTVNMVKALPD